MTRLFLLALLLPSLAHASPLCLSEATATALTHLGTPTDFRKVARELPVHADGVDLFDLRIWLADHGWGARVLTPEPLVLQKLLAAGWPLIVVRTEPRHAVALLPAPNGQVAVVDAGTTLLQPAAPALAGLHVAMVVWRGPGQVKEPQAPPGDPRIDAEFQATGWLRRARQHPAANEAQLALVLRAVVAAPCFAPARQRLAEVTRLLSPTPNLRATLATVPVCRR